jgi:hypothetical protein
VSGGMAINMWSVDPLAIAISTLKSEVQNIQPVNIGSYKNTLIQAAFLSDYKIPLTD